QQGADERLKNRDFCVNLRYFHRTQGILKMQSNITISESRLNYFDPTYPNQAGRLDHSFVQREFYGSHATAIKSEDKLSFGLSQDLIINTLATNLTGYEEAGRLTSLTVAATRWHYNRWSLNGSLLATVVAENQANGNQIPLLTRLSPSLSAGFRISNTPMLRIRFSYSENFRMPTFNDLYYTLSGNRNLLPETARLLNLGVVATHKWSDKLSFLIGIDLYRNRVADKIIAIPTQNLFVWSMRNLGQVNIEGAEFHLDATVKAFRNLEARLTLNYSRQEARDLTTPKSPVYGHQIAYIPFETLSASATLSNTRLSVGYYVLFNGFRYALGENFPANFMPGWYVSDVSAKYEFGFSSFNFIIRGAINNLFDHQYEVIRSFPMPGRSFNFSILLQY
ncbi:MAG TPA: TonB-dependent receptor, partial [Bacteroidales bacterium]|nr:TonB-dependent receptor [Bacteroidales bacterium]